MASLSAACPECGEKRRTSLVVSPTTERFPLPIYKRTCKVCGATWIQDENLAPVPLPTRADIQ